MEVKEETMVGERRVKDEERAAGETNKICHKKKRLSRGEGVSRLG